MSSLTGILIVGLRNEGFLTFGLGPNYTILVLWRNYGIRKADSCPRTSPWGNAVMVFAPGKNASHAIIDMLSLFIIKVCLQEINQTPYFNIINNHKILKPINTSQH